MNVNFGEANPCPKCGATLQTINRTVKIGQSADGRVQSAVERFSRCTNEDCDYKETLGRAYRYT